MGLLKWLAAALGSRHIERSRDRYGISSGSVGFSQGNTTWWYPVHDQQVGQGL